MPKRENKTQSIKVRVSPREKARIERAAAVRGMDTSAYMRVLALNAGRNTKEQNR